MADAGQRCAAMMDPLVLVIGALGSVVGALTFVFGLFIKAQDRAYVEMKGSCDSRYKDMKDERDRVLASQELSNQNVVAVLGVIRAGVDGMGASLHAQTATMQAQTATMQTLQRLIERAADDTRDRDVRDDQRDIREHERDARDRR